METAAETGREAGGIQGTVRTVSGGRCTVSGWGGRLIRQNSNQNALATPEGDTGAKDEPPPGAGAATYAANQELASERRDRDAQVLVRK